MERAFRAAASSLHYFMPNDYFQFKQFLIKQDKCTMKVCTDACLFGAWAADIINNEELMINNALDIGTGTGLLSLMLAQKINNVNIDAVEIDEAAAHQAKENFDASLWKEKLRVYNTAIQQFANSQIQQYDLIISNPPFYENDLKSDDEKRNLALHSSDLKLEELINIADALLNNDGNFFVLLPYHRTEYFVQSIQNKFFVREKVCIKQTSKHNYFRSMLWLTKQHAMQNQSRIIIMNDNNNYSEAFISLLKDYYLYL
jgi:tRNA1Val (adenine37-N6)-methyltransferase